MTRRASFRSAPLSNRIFVGLLVLLAHGLLLVRLASVLEPGVDDGRHARQSSMGVTFITLPKADRRVPSSQDPSIPQVSRAVEATKLTSSPTQSSSAIEESLVEQSTSESAQSLATQKTSSNEGLRAQYKAAIRTAIERKWQQLGQSSALGKCTLLFTQSAGGVVASATTDDCDLPDEERWRLEAAVLMAQPLPYKGYESVFATEMDVRF